MTELGTSPRIEDLQSVGSRISWGAILAGAFLAMGIYFLLTTLGGAVGLSISERTSIANLQTSAILWAFVTTLAALFVGGLVTSLFTVGENKTEAVLSGVITWAVVAGMLMFLGAAGSRSGFNAMTNMSSVTTEGTTANLDPVTRNRTVDSNPTREGTTVNLDTATRLSWYAFAGSWLSMLAAAGGALVGAGPTFRIVAVTSSRRVVVSGNGLDDRLSPVAGNGSRGSSFPAEVNK